MQSTASKVGEVKLYFEKSHQYFNGRQFDIKIRAETVKEFAEGFQYRRILDIGCGDGSISLPLLNRDTRITLLDLSSAMTSVALSNIPPELRGNAEVLNQDFMKADIAPGSYDLIVCLGVLAHVDSPADFIAKIATVLRPGGRLIFELTDSFHIVGRLTRLYQALCAIRKPQKYRLNVVSFAPVARMLRSEKLRLMSVFRYSLTPIPGIPKLMTQTQLYNMARGIYGNSRNNRNAWLGNEYICLLTRD
jgi:2-polyprenyl-3-methyl-5-hydroxy-6-metoxy-1,4-benzoquinol methylase